MIIEYVKYSLVVDLNKMPSVDVLLLYDVEVCQIIHLPILTDHKVCQLFTYLFFRFPH